MATQTVEFAAASGLTLTVKLFAAGSDTVVASVSATEATNRLGLYSAAYTDAAAGTYKLIALSGTTPVATWWADLTLTTATFQSYEIPVSVIQSGLATQASVDVIDGIVDTILIDTNELQADWADGGRLDLKLDTIINISPMGVF